MNPIEDIPKSGRVNGLGNGLGKQAAGETIPPYKNNHMTL